MEISKERISGYFRGVRTSARRRVRRFLTVLPYMLLAAGAAAVIVSGVRIVQIRGSQKAQIAAEVWAGDSGTRFRQISCFALGQTQADGSPDLYLSSAVSLNTADIEMIRTALDAKVSGISGSGSGGKDDGSVPIKESAGDIAAETSEDKEPADGTSEGETPESGDSAVSGEDEGEGRLWIDAYSADAECTLQSKATDITPEKQASITVTGVGGDYYLFHPFRVLYGAFLSEGTLDPRKIVLDKELAFKLFGTYNTVGSTVYINDREYTVVGVVEQADTKIDRETSGALMHAYVPFDELAYLAAGEIKETADAAASPAGSSAGTSAAETSGFADGNPDSSVIAVTCYEVVLPDRIEGISRQYLEDAMETAGKTAKNFLIVENTGRFSFLRLYDTVFPVGETGLERLRYNLPFWELSAEMAESVLIFWWILLMTGAGTVLASALAVYTGFRHRKDFENGL